MGSTSNPYLYNQQQFDHGLGLYYLRARYYSTNNGRFYSPDSYQGTEADPHSLHKYVYAAANPAAYSDPSGQSEVSLTSLTIAISIIAVVTGISVGFLTGSVRAGIFGGLSVPIFALAFRLGGPALLAKALGFAILGGLIDGFVGFLVEGRQVTPTVWGDFFSGFFFAATITTVTLGYPEGWFTTLEPWKAGAIIGGVTEFLSALSHGASLKAAILAAIVAAAFGALTGNVASAITNRVSRMGKKAITAGEIGGETSPEKISEFFTELWDKLLAEAGGALFGRLIAESEHALGSRRR